MATTGVIGPDYVLAQELAQELGVSLRTLIRWRKMRKSPPVTIVGRNVYYRREAVKEWMRAREDTPRSDLRPRIEVTTRQRNARQHNPRRTAKP